MSFERNINNMKNTRNRTKSRYNKKHTSTKDVGYGTKKEALTDMGMDNQHVQFYGWNGRNNFCSDKFFIYFN